jgi:hypothetical protein
MSPSTDRGSRSVRDQEDRRLLDPGALLVDVGILRRRIERTRGRLLAFPPDSPIAGRFRIRIEGLEERLAQLERGRQAYEETGWPLDANGVPRLPVGSRVRSVRARNLAVGEEGVITSYTRGRLEVWDRIRVRRADGSTVAVGASAVELVELPPRPLVG